MTQPTPPTPAWFKSHVAALQKLGFLQTHDPATLWVSILRESPHWAQGHAPKGEAAALAILAHCKQAAWIDLECVEDPGCYASVVRELASISGGAFAPEDVSDDLPWLLEGEDPEDEDAAGAVTVTWRAKTSEFPVHFRNDWLDLEAVLGGLNGMLQSAGVDGQFHAFNATRDQTVQVVFLSTAQAKRARAEGIF